ncbi:transglutaminase domain-containing protein [Rarobacter faecitabidus]|uniref:Transglutaminase superfamily protein n=1 Tax=Rarobacter faecitabidus TaxID=13243 RepID=A0A542ZTS0_RARFA|nr:transglutaminase domain-containing protein [Rarobacter faecitabidus]TQL63751.1 transglutaminase superfamily protein [Rarobacter faecitabidus]
MSAPSTSEVRRGTWHKGERAGRILAIDAVAVAILFGLATWLAWPVYQSWYFIVSVVVAVALAAALAAGATVRRVRARNVWLLWLGVYLVSVTPAAIPSALWAFPANLRYGLWGALTGPVTAWKELVSLDPPVGSFGTALVPGYVVFGTVALGLVLLQLRRPAWVGWQLAASVVPLLFAILVGPAVLEDINGPLGRDWPSAREALIGAVWAVVAILWLTSRFAVRHRRVQAVEEGGQARGRLTVGAVARWFAGALTLALGGVVAVTFVPHWLPERAVARSVVQPHVIEPPADSPLAAYRAYFRPGTLDAELFTVTGKDVPSRVRIATLSSYRGDTFTAIDPRDPGTDFRQLAYRLSDVPGTPRDVRITIGELGGVWLPTAGQAVQVRYSGASALSLSASTYVSRSTTGLIVMAERSGGTLGLERGDRYDLTYVDPPAASSTARSPHLEPDWTDSDLPSMYAWLEREGIDLSTVGGVQQAVDALMAASYVGHSFDDPTGGTGNRASTWLAGLPGTYEFRPSYAGHALRSIDDRVFAPLLSDDYVPCSGPQDTQCAAVVGDDEQFAVAAALIAQSAGYPSRVVLGADVAANGLVRGRDMRAWAEIQSADGQWAPIEATARTDNTFVEQESQPQWRDHNNPVDRDETVQTPPPDVRSQTGGHANDSPAGEHVAGSGSATLVKIAAMTSLGLLFLLLLTMPFWLALWLKSSKRKRRATRGSAEDQIAAGWDEYIDRIVDLGTPPPGTATRTEFAGGLGDAESSRLAILADAAVFGDRDPQAAEREEYWRLLSDTLANRYRDATAGERLRAKISWRSLMKDRRRGAESGSERIQS